jgi:hypothetical protein
MGLHADMSVRVILHMIDIRHNLDGEIYRTVTGNGACRTNSVDSRVTDDMPTIEAVILERVVVRMVNAAEICHSLSFLSMATKKTRTNDPSLKTDVFLCG